MGRPRLHKFEFRHGDLGDLTLPRLYCYDDGDGTNALYLIGLNLGTKYGDPFLSFGCELVIPPRWFPALDFLTKRLARAR